MNAFDVCLRCAHPRKDHMPPASYAYAKTGFTSGKAHDVQIQARTCCWEQPMCTCIAFVEPTSALLKGIE